ncbi:uncharacterized mitochondrial protein AtMg00810-like [Nicotiana sylvestris]|uniref:uncharacterized mitochondrial protein AtMg00810-like n=1 Tax=Nicotiana sylvestris TaxID=4096 RepID=UPI00388CC10B
MIYKLLLKIKDLGELKYFLGIEFVRNSDGILMHQCKYALELIAELVLLGSKPVSCPMEPNVKLTTAEFDTHIDTSEDTLLTDPWPYQRLLGKLLYLTVTRPDISFVVQSMSQFMHSPKVSHMAAALKVVRYIKSSSGLGVLLAAKCSESLSAFCDADWATCPNTRKSVTGYFIKLDSSLVSWKSKKQSTISRSSAEAEYRNLASIVAEITWIIGLLKELGVDHNSHVYIYNDSKSAFAIAANHVFHEHTKHIILIVISFVKRFNMVLFLFSTVLQLSRKLIYS